MWAPSSTCRCRVYAVNFVIYPNSIQFRRKVARNTCETRGNFLNLMVDFFAKVILEIRTQFSRCWWWCGLEFLSAVLCGHAWANAAIPNSLNQKGACRCLFVHSIWSGDACGNSLAQSVQRAFFIAQSLCPLVPFGVCLDVFICFIIYVFLMMICYRLLKRVFD